MEDNKENKKIENIENINIKEIEPYYHAEKCVVCNGFGSLKYGTITCQGCNGKGYILVPNFKIDRKNDKLYESETIE